MVFCGTAPSKASANARAYYAKPGNVFWQTLHHIGLTPRRFAPQEYAELLSLGIGLTDICKSASGNDDELPDKHIRPDLLWQKIDRYRPRLLAFSSKNSAQLALGRKVEYGLQAEKHGETRLFVCPSTSGRARRFFDEAHWQALSELYHSL